MSESVASEKTGHHDSETVGSERSTPSTVHENYSKATQKPQIHTNSYAKTSHDKLGQSIVSAPAEVEELPTGEELIVRPAVTNASSTGPVYSVFTKNQKRFIVFMASWAGFFSPVSGMIYFPALNSLERDLGVSATLINLTLTSYMIFQGLAPAFIGDLADSMGRRVAYAVCFTIYIFANLGLALQNSYAALFVLRCLQSTGSSGTIAMASGVVSDVATAAERGRYIGIALAGSLVGPAIGPAIGGVLSEFLGWRAIFWFLLILAVVFMVIFAIFFPETARSQVGNGSIPPKGWNMSLMNYMAVRKARQQDIPLDDQDDDNNHNNNHNHLQSTQTTTSLPSQRKMHFPNPFSSLHVLLDKENSLLLFYNGFLFSCSYCITAAIPSQFNKIYHFNDLQIGLCYIPYGVGSMLAALVNGQLLDRNFARWCRNLDVPIRKGRNNDLTNFPIERARLQLAIPAAYAYAIATLVFGWVLDIEGPLAAQLVILFLGSFFMSLASNVTSTLLVDFYPSQPATATAANNLVRCLLGAGATAALVPLIDAIGRGWTFTLLGVGLVVTSPMLWVIYFRGMGWREERRVKDELGRAAKEEKKRKDDVADKDGRWGRRRRRTTKEEGKAKS